MTAYEFSLSGTSMQARADGTLWLPEARALCVADLHFGKSERMARRGGSLLPPYDSTETLIRLADAVRACNPATVYCLGDSFDDDAAGLALPPDIEDGLTGLMAGREWVWIAGNHDPAPIALGGSHRDRATVGPVTLRHIADPSETGPELSGHYHPKHGVATRAGRQVRRCFLISGARAILPAFGCYTGGLSCTKAPLDALLKPGAVAVMLGRRAVPVPLDRALA
ncbi:ligase-associated DNA damage response endonuclease PdeM [Oceanomicrobium pacificus]|uniref:Ligase-associated DNA damage response endonuclease PdeM n=1 Tax=Oceanomicrobium pacificus TaxID=2692916 RepID=A0A6B0TVY9_9RHOB|nr:ligase-associated DNA damage response endonuclease PdeM [Oceanomicrobium pacificus]MXU65324.1 ligase-associated DNA damage response endonuclease PdeM [Oceanomicrobium pacificus]